MSDFEQKSEERMMERANSQPCLYEILSSKILFKGIVSRDFEGLQMILMHRTWVPNVPMKVYSFLKLHLHIVFLF